ncbi:sigma-70 family RNA polymerase sigma factor [Aetokthonos hydrillicola Thurmond2011]|jgi:RNA polymerase sigma-70 factor (ECF subfamily)|uniref:Sigma-70 family RNA polymerase sigma factor n=1 Tax=Aetokthonos hydrillicola Thurmond2011 TaxID=2712845 RepID=A0AAP5M718_9CYAN|nr:sigma-70 family RNA polymerase sigma factor [Aetokthonos hydrillicola]MBO3461091.1 sigma-70 family RNA polymerase sigma factor [Aetokthonos hydrillicola CCALA 1050]MBW4590688.1 sigma-70 family RNA polymerase sigma factor [Aetokthonos hydrillicola CCALA 1050]MDR9897666.1 sigma-70 family RNA polymerase sigma factor [Aetokthonos hydrillicola Thurmond2011]
MESSSPNNPSPEPPPPLTDKELLDRLRSKESSALSILYDRYSGVVYGIALKLLQNSQEAEDLTQEIFLALWRKMNVYPDNFLAYLVTMTRSRAIDKLRDRARKTNLLQRFSHTFTSESPSPTPFEVASLTERSSRVRDALGQLPQQQRQVIEMAYDKGLSQSEIAQKLDKPLGTVKTWTRQGLLKLKQILQDTID